MTSISRRAFLEGHWFGTSKNAEPEELRLPPDFTPAMIDIQARALGLTPEAMNRDDLEKAVARYFWELQSAPGADEQHNDMSDCGQKNIA